MIFFFKKIDLKKILFPLKNNHFERMINNDVMFKNIYD